MLRYCFLLICGLQGGLAAQNLDELDSLIGKVLDLSNYEQALSLARDYQQQALQQSGAESRRYAHALCRLCEVYAEQNAFQPANEHCLQSVQLYERLAGKTDRDYLLALHQWANLHLDKGEFHYAEELLTEEKTGWEQLGQTHDNDYATCLQRLGYAHRMQGHFGQSEELYLQCKQLRADLFGYEHLQYAAILDALGGLYRSMGHYSQSEPFYLEALSIRERFLGKEHLVYANTLSHLGLLYRELDRHDEAHRLFNDALNIRKRLVGVRHPDYAQSLHTLGLLHWDMAQLDEARRYYLQALSIQGEALGVHHPFYTISLNNLAGIYIDLKQYDAAIQLYQKSYENWRQSYGFENGDCALSLQNLATVYWEKKDLERSLQYTLLAFDANSPDLDSTIRLDLAFLQQLGKSGYYSYPMAIRSMKQLKKILLHHYKKTKDIKWMEWVYHLLESVILLDQTIQLEFTSEGDKIRLLQQNAHAAEEGIELALWLEEHGNGQYEHIDQAFTFAEQNKSVLLSEALRTQHARSFGNLPDSLSKREYSMQRRLQELQKRLLETHSTNERQQLQSFIRGLEIEIKYFQRQLEQDYPKYHRLKYQPLEASVAAVQHILQRDMAFLEYFVADTAVYLFVLTTHKVRIHRISVNSDELNAHVESLRTALSDYDFISTNLDSARAQYAHEAHWFYQQFLAPALSELQGIYHLVVVPDGVLGHLPFEAFLTRKADTAESYSQLPYLVRDYRISYSYSAVLWVESYRHPPAANSLILAMAANYPNELDSNLVRHRSAHLRELRKNLQPLGSVQNEIKRLENLFKGNFLYQIEANEEEFKQKAHEYGILHFAMHGLLNKKAPLFSGLAFTEDGNSEEDNFLQAYEIAQLQLHASLVVLSACETGYGKFQQGEGVMSLGRAFMYAGVPALVVSLWSVNDQSTERLMAEFYQQLAHGFNKAEALRQAKLRYLEAAKGQSAHPAYWAPFIHIGDSRPIRLHRRTEWWWWALGGVVLLGLVAGRRSQVASRKK